MLYARGRGDEVLWLGLSVVGPIGRKATWKVVWDFHHEARVSDRFGLDRGRVVEILLAISRTPDDKIRRYPTREAAKDAVEEALLKIGLVGPRSRVKLATFEVNPHTADWTVL